MLTPEDLMTLNARSGNALNQAKVAVGKLQLAVSAIKETAYSVDKQNSLIAEARQKVMGEMAPSIRMTQEIANLAAKQKPFFESKAYLASVATFKECVGPSSNATVRATLYSELKTMPAALVALVLSDAKSRNDAATVFQVFRVSNERGKEPGFNDAIGANTIFDGLVFEGRDKALAAIQACSVNVRASENWFGVASGRIKEVSGPALDIARDDRFATNMVALAAEGDGPQVGAIDTSLYE